MDTLPEQPADSSSSRIFVRSLAVLFLCALAVRVLFFVTCRTHAGDDDGSQLDIAQNLLAGKGYVTYRKDLAHTPYYAFLPPLFPLILVGAKTVFPHQAVLALRLFESLCGALSCVLVARLGRRLIGASRGHWAGWALAFYPGHIFWSTRLLAESIVMLFSLTALYLVLEAAPKKKCRPFFAAGLLCALCALGRGEFLLLVAVIAGWLFLAFRSPSGTRLILSLLCGFVLGMSPWVIRNTLVFRRFVMVSSNYGENFYFAHSPHYHFGGESFPLPPARARHIAGMNEHQIEDQYLAAGTEFIRQHPWLTVLSTVINGLVFWRPNLTAGYVPWAENVVYTFFSFFLLAFFWMGVHSVFALRDRRDWMLILSVIAYKFLIHLPFYIVIRFREAVAPLLVLVAVFGFLTWWEQRSAGAVKTGGFALDQQ